MIIDRLSVLASLFGTNWGAARQFAKRWQKAAMQQPELRTDLIRLGGLFVLPPVQMVNGYPEPVTIDPYQSGREAGRRELAMQLLAACGVTIEDLNQMMETQDVD